MFIQTETTSSPATLKFLPGQQVLASGTVDFQDAESAKRSPLALRLFEIEGVSGVYLDPQSIIVHKADDKEWQLLKPLILGVIMEVLTTGAAVVGEAAAADDLPPEFTEETEVAANIRELIETRIRPAAVQDGGDVVYKGLKDGVVYLQFSGGAMGLKAGIENMLRHYAPEVTSVSDFRDALPKPGMDTPEAQTVQQILEERINPSVAAHGGYISLVDVREDTVYIRLEGGCQGCGMADVTLKQGIETEIKRALPQIAAVLDVTDHAGGNNPYYQPGKGGMNPW